jgi:hypothetical protein
MTKPTVPCAIAKAIRFIRSEDGAVTIDWIVLTAGMVFLGAAAGFFATSEVPALAGRIDTSLQSMTVMPN